MERNDRSQGVRTRRRGRELLEAIFRATRAELAEGGYARLTMEGVAARASTGKATLYRRWTSKRDLVLDALRDTLPEPALPEAAGLRETLLALLGAMSDILAGRTAFPGATVLAEVLLEPELAEPFREELVQGRLDLVRSVLDQAVERGELSWSPAAPLAARTGPALVLQAFLMTGAAPSPEELEEIVDLVMLPLLKGGASKDILNDVTPRQPRQPDQPPHPHHRHRDPGALRAIAHPVRMRLLELVAVSGSATATELADRVGESPANTSWHLRQLAKYGYLEPAGGGSGRERPWRYVPRSYSHGTSDETGELALASDAAGLMVAEHEFDQFRRWEVGRRGAPPEWQDAAFMSQTLAWLTPAELADAGREVNALFRQAGRMEQILDPARRTPDGRMARLFAWGVPGEG